jgi:hypothetical protein
MIQLSFSSLFLIVTLNILSDAFSNVIDGAVALNSYVVGVYVFTVASDIAVVDVLNVHAVTFKLTVHPITFVDVSVILATSAITFILAVESFLTR